MRVLDSLRRAVRWHRRGIAALLVAVAVLAGLNVLSSRTTGGVPVVVAARGLRAGTAVAASDLTLVLVPPALVPDEAITDPAQAAGRVAVVGIPARQVLTGSVLLGDDAGASPGHVGLPVSFGTSPAVALLRVGSRIDVLGPAASGSGYGVVASDVVVRAIPAVEDPGMLSGSTSRIVVLDVTADQAVAIAGSMAVSSLSFAVH